jgi:hypothetical protein
LDTTLHEMQYESLRVPIMNLVSLLLVQNLLNTDLQETRHCGLKSTDVMQLYIITMPSYRSLYIGLSTIF